jgi:hypothetical protein
MNHPYFTTSVAKARHQQLIQEAETYRLIKTVRKNRPSLRQRCGQFLSAMGHRLLDKAGIPPSFMSEMQPKSDEF